MNLETVHGATDTVDEAVRQIHSTIEALKTLPFFGGLKLVHLKDASFLADTVTGRSETVQNALADLLDTVRPLPPEEVMLVISAHGVDKRRSFFKQFSSLAKVELFDRIDISRAQDLSDWLEQVDAALKDAELDPDELVVEHLVELIGNDSRALHAEIEKLKLYVHPHRRVTLQDIRAICSPNREMVVWDLCDAITEGRSADALKLLHQLLAQGESEVGLLILLGGHIRLAALGTHLQETGKLFLRKKGNWVDVELAPEADSLLPRNRKGEKPNTFRMGKVVRQASRRKARSWFHAVEIIHQTHREMFRSGTDQRQLLEKAVADLCLIV